jgi:hypothetical protein
MNRGKKGENCLHYDEAAKLFPQEFSHLFEKYAPKKVKQSRNDDMIGG